MQSSINNNSLGFISFDPLLRDSDNPRHSQLDQDPVGFALAQVAGIRFEFIEIIELFAFPVDRARLIHGILLISESWPFSKCFCDQQNGNDLQTYLWLNQDREWHHQVTAHELARPSNHEYPRLVPVATRNKIASIRQRDWLTGRLTPRPGQKHPDVIFSDNIAASININELLMKPYSPELDALAGCVQEAIKIQQRLQRSLTLRQVDCIPRLIAFT